MRVLSQNMSLDPHFGVAGVVTVGAKMVLPTGLVLGCVHHVLGLGVTWGGRRGRLSLPAAFPHPGLGPI